ncbi:MAG TPA: 50S ribosomal protein L21 [Planctomycetes bacterium]|nr:50S ribosomal protein L21 [Planctomycetota bacterium]
MYAFIQDGGRQVRVEPGKTVYLDYRDQWSPGEEVLLDKVLLLGGEELKVGSPYVEGVQVRAKVEGHVKGKKIVVFRFKRRKNVRVKKGFRPRYTKVRVEEFSVA